jgi:7-cyano-7-deazaguanine synthase
MGIFLKNKKKQAIVLLSGGLDSTTMLYLALQQGYSCKALIINYNQRHKKEIRYAVNIAKKLNVDYKISKVELPWGGNALLDKNLKIPNNKKIGNKIPITYVPARNIIFLSLAASYAETVGAMHIFIGANIVDYSGYPDCRGDFLTAMEKTLNKGTTFYNKKCCLKIKAPLLKLSKIDIIKLAIKLKVNIDLTWSCYEGKRVACGVCDTCKLKENALAQVTSKRRI